MTLDNDTRNELANFAAELLYDHLHDIMMRNMSILEENDRYHNWYHGYTQIMTPFLSSTQYILTRIYNYDVYTSASSGSVFTQHFGEQFDADKVERKIINEVKISPPKSVRNNPNVTLHLDVEIVSLRDLSEGRDKLSVTGTDIQTAHRSFNYSPPTDEFYSIKLRRQVITGDINKQKLQQMPGFRVTWHYSGMEVEPVAKYNKNAITKAFRRYFQ